jgi:hypothetical protein
MKKFYRFSCWLCKIGCARLLFLCFVCYACFAYVFLPSFFFFNRRDDLYLVASFVGFICGSTVMILLVVSFC